MYKRLAFLCSLFITTIAFGQITISGVVSNAKGKPLVGVSISLVDSYDGGVTDAKGKYSFTTTEVGNQKILFAKEEMDSLSNVISIGKEPIVLNITLQKSKNSLDEVVMTSRSFMAGDNKRNTIMTPMDMYTTAGTNGDITSALKTLPGTQQSNEREGLLVHGGDVYETKQFIDGTLVNNPYYTGAANIATRTRYPPALFKEVSFGTGGYSALYGQALSSALILGTVDIPERTETNASVFPMFASIGTQQVARDKKSSYGLNYSYVNVLLYNKVVKQKLDFFHIPQFHNVDANFRVKTGNGGIVKYYGSFSYNKMGMRRASVDSLIYKNQFNLNSHNTYHNLSWRQPLRNNWKLDVGLSFSNNRDQITQVLVDQDNQPIALQSVALDTLNFDVDKIDNLAQGKVVVEKKLSGGMNAIRFGGEWWHAYGTLHYNDFGGKLVDNYVSSFAESEIFITRRLALQPGLRYEHSSLVDASNIAPRMSLAYKIAKGSNLVAAYGIFYQKQENNYLYYNRYLPMAKSTHYILTYTYIQNGLILRGETYYKSYDHLLKYRPTYNTNGNGDAKGLDIYIRDKKRTFKNIEYSISYSYVDTKRDYLNFPVSMQPYFVAKHTANVVLKDYVSAINTGFGLTYNYSSPRPYYNIRLNAQDQFYIADHGNTNNFNSLNFSLYRLTSIMKGFGIIIASVNNIFGSNNISGYQYSVNGIHKQAIVPPAKRSFNIGLIVSWGVDRTEDNINNNL